MLFRSDPMPVARTVAFLLSDWASGITGEIVHVDGGFHAMGGEVVLEDTSEPEPEAEGPADEG